MKPRKLGRIAVPGFASGSRESTTRAIISLNGESDCGKTTLARCYPADYWAIMDVDFGAHRAPETLTKAFAERTLIKRYPVAAPRVPKPTIKGRPKTHDQIAEEQELAAVEAERISATVMSQFEDDLFALLKSRTDVIIFDKATEVWRIVKASYTGKLAKIPQTAYTEMNGRYTSWLREVANAGKTLILIHELKDEYREQLNNKGEKESKPTGRRIPDWMKSTPGLSDIILSCYRTTPRDKDGRVALNTSTIEVEVVKGGDAVGMTFDLTDHDEHFKADAWLDIGPAVRPDVNPKLWVLS